MINKIFAKFFKQPTVASEKKLNELKKVNGVNGKKIDNMIKKINGSKLEIIVVEEIVHADTRTQTRGRKE